VTLSATASDGASLHPVAYGQAVTISGRLTNAQGEPLADVKLDVLGHLHMAGAKGEILGSVTTAKDGTFAYAVAAGPSRIITIGYRHSLADRSYAAYTSAKVLVTPAVSLRSSRTRVGAGGVIVLSGSVQAAPAGARKVAQMQVKVGRAWRTFASTRLNGSRLRYAHRFHGTATETTRYQLRARITSDPSWPFASATSKPVTVTVTAAKAHRTIGGGFENGAAH
jgi:hypothetical protein